MAAERQRPTLGVVVIARNEATHIAKCLEAVLRVAAGHAGASVVLVDSGSTDATVSIASEYPVTIYRYGGPVRTAAAGRRLGAAQIDAEHVLFVDGDCVLEPEWLPGALERLRSDPSVAVVYGWRRDIYVGRAADYRSSGPRPEEYGIGGNALYRKRVLDEVGGFNPYLVAEEEAELIGRIAASGYRAVDTHTVMFAHHTDPRDTIAEFWRRHRSGLVGGPGPVLRIALRDGRLRYHVRAYNRYLSMLAYLVFGFACAVAALATGRAPPVLIWAGAGAVAFGALALRRGSLRSAAFIATDWLLVAVNLIPGLARAPREASSFAPALELVSAPDQRRS